MNLQHRFIKGLTDLGAHTVTISDKDTVPGYRKVVVGVHGTKNLKALERFISPKYTRFMAIGGLDNNFEITFHIWRWKHVQNRKS